MDYIAAMQRLAKYRTDLRESNVGTQAPYNFIKKMKDRSEAADRIDKSNVADWARTVLGQCHGDTTPYLHKEIASGCSLFGEGYAQQLEKETAAYEGRMVQIRESAQKELAKGNKKSGKILDVDVTSGEDNEEPTLTVKVFNKLGETKIKAV